MNVVIDTNVLVSAALKNRMPETVLRWIVAQPGWAWVVSTEILAEYKTVLARQKFGLPPDLLHQWLTWLDTVTVCVDVPGTPPYPRIRPTLNFSPVPSPPKRTGSLLVTAISHRLVSSSRRPFCPSRSSRRSSVTRRHDRSHLWLTHPPLL